MQSLGLSEFSSQFSPRISLSKVREQVWHRAVPDSSKYQSTSAPKRSALYPQIHQSSWTVLLCSWSLWQMQQARKRCPTFFFPKVSGVFSVSSLRSCTCSLPAAWALWSVPVIDCSCLALHVTTSVLELSAFCFHRTYLLGSVPGSFFMLGIFKQAFIKLGTCFWWVIDGNYNTKKFYRVLQMILKILSDLSSKSSSFLLAPFWNSVLLLVIELTFRYSLFVCHHIIKLL